MNLKKTIAIVAVMALAVGALAQGGGQGRRGFGQFGFGGGSSVGLLRRDDVKEELKLTDDQKSKVSDLLQKDRDRQRAAREATGVQFGPDMSAEDMKKLQDAAAKASEETTKDLDGILTPEQSKRLKELAIQRQGNAVALNPTYQKDLGITDDQKAKLADLQKKQGEAMRTLGEKMRNQEIDMQGFREAMQKNQKIMNDEIGKLLTDDQKKKISDMSGKPFTFKDDTGN